MPMDEMTNRMKSVHILGCVCAVFVSTWLLDRCTLKVVFYVCECVCFILMVRRGRSSK